MRRACKKGARTLNLDSCLRRDTVRSIFLSITVLLPLTLGLYPRTWAHAAALVFIFQWVQDSKGGVSHTLPAPVMGTQGQSPHPLHRLCAMGQGVFHRCLRVFETIVLQCQWALLLVCLGGEVWVTQTHSNISIIRGFLIPSSRAVVLTMGVTRGV